MPDDPIRIEGRAELLAKLTRLDQLEFVQGALLQGGAHLAGKLKEYPPQSHRPQGFRSDQQRRGFFYHLRHGHIEVPYQRGSSPGSKNLKQLWTVARTGTLRIEIGNLTPYGPLVQDRDAQTAYHRETGWKTAQDVAEQEESVVLDYVDEALKQAVEKD
jgi:hypothetical protein